MRRAVASSHATSPERDTVAAHSAPATTTCSSSTARPASVALVEDGRLPASGGTPVLLACAVG